LQFIWHYINVEGYHFLAHPGRITQDAVIVLSFDTAAAARGGESKVTTARERERERERDCVAWLREADAWLVTDHQLVIVVCTWVMSLLLLHVYLRSHYNTHTHTPADRS